MAAGPCLYWLFPGCISALLASCRTQVFFGYQADRKQFCRAFHHKKNGGRHRHFSRSPCIWLFIHPPKDYQARGGHIFAMRGKNIAAGKNAAYGDASGSMSRSRGKGLVLKAWARPFCALCPGDIERSGNRLRWMKVLISRPILSLLFAPYCPAQKASYLGKIRGGFLEVFKKSGFFH